MAEVKFQGGFINYSEKGEGNAVVFLHGFLESKEIWDDYSEILSKEYKVICIDLPGFGETKIFREIHSMKFMAEAVKTVLVNLDIKECLMVGHSMGGYVTLEFLKLFPEYLKGIVMFHSHAADDNKKAKVNRDRMIKIVEEDRKGFITQFISDLFAPENTEKHKKQIKQLIEKSNQTKNEGIIAALKGMKERTDKLDLLSETEIPVKYILGKKDSRIPLERAIKQIVLPVHSEVMILGDVGHMGFIEAREKTLKALKYFLHNCYS